MGHLLCFAKYLTCVTMSYGLALVFLCTSAAAELVNVALNKPVTAYYSCGYFGKEMYTTMTDAYSSVSSRPRRSCVDINAPDTVTLNQQPSVTVRPSYPAEAMVDGSQETWWQSTSRTRLYYYGQALELERTRKLEAVIDIDLNQEFLMAEIILQLGDALTPQKISILKSLDNKTFIPWIFAVTVNDRCGTFFNTTYKTIPESSADTVCINFLADDKPPGDTITFDLSLVPTALKEWTRVRYLKIKFYDMLFVYPFNSLADTYNHYVVTELTARAECTCNGQQTGCAISNETGMYECTCGGNTRGRFCESCLPLFNQFDFQYGKPCTECNCFGHSTTCFYKSSVEKEKLSIDKNGSKNGGGVCFDCKNNTAGINCEKCADFYYRPIDRVQTAENACIPCYCNSSGSTVNSVTNLVDCVMNNDNTLTTGKLPGDCFCKKNVMGSKCDTCKPGFYNLQQSNPLGCSDCECYKDGTVGGNNTICKDDSVGQCTCKANVDGRACDKCRDGFYNLTSDSLLGCTPCNCDVGGSLNHICDKLTGQCVCVSPNIIGRSCDSIQQGFYYPSPHSIFTELEDSVGEVVVNRNPLYSGFSGKGYVIVGSGKSISFLITIPRNTDLSNDYVSIIIYRSQVTSNITIQVQSADEDVINKTLIIPPCPNSWCQMIGSDKEFLTLYPGLNLISAIVNSGSALLDKFIALPIEFTNVTQLLTKPLPKECDLVKNTLPSNATDLDACQKVIFTVTMYYWNAPLPCLCDITGSVGMYCNVIGGQCQCQHGVTGRTCNKCFPDHFAFTSTGCTACNCTGSNPSCDIVTGQCLCPDNTIGRQCEFCIQNNWNWSKTEGCQDCECHPFGSVSLQCNATTGVCKCQGGFEGVKCDTCMDEYYMTNDQFCSPCLCDSMGSDSPVCNKTTGKCSCKENTVGQQCNSCDIGSFGLESNPTQGCLKCVCMGITMNCTSAGVRISYDFYNLVNKSDNSIKLKVVDENGMDYLVTPYVDPNYIGAVLLYVYSNQSQLYWKMPDNYVFNLLSLYGSELNFTLNYISISSSPMLALNATLIDVQGEKLIYPIYNVTKGVYTNHKVLLKESGWRKLKNGVTPTRGEFLKALSTAKALLIPASFEAGNHTALLSKLFLSSVSNDGPVNPAVEQCQCGEGYLGRSCESCAPGYKRINSNTSEYLGDCVPCECNGHSSFCDASTGICQDCQNNTAGPSCEVCKIGYYGDPLIGCTKCPCNQPRVINESCHLQNSSDGLSSIAVCNFCSPGYIGNLCDSCDLNYYGEPMKPNGSCLLCECNGNAQSCDNITGLCSFCSSNTTGSKCEHCLDGFYGNASLQNCKECNCRAANFTNCDRLTGQCTCLPGTEGRDCSYCIPNYWGFNSSSGCQPCQCVEQGSISLQCNNNTGQCSCKPNTSGDSCSVCDEGFYGLPKEPCKVCDCNKTGSVAGISCNKTTGHCNCQPGIGGQKCDQCLPMFVNFSSSGCQECGQCQKSLGEDIKSLTQVGQNLSSKTKAILDVQKEGSRLQNLSSKLNESLNLLGLAGSNATDIQELVTEVDGVKRILRNSFEMTKSAVSQFSIIAQEINNNSGSLLTKFNGMKEISANLTSSAVSLEDKLNNYLIYLGQFNQTASQYQNRNSSIDGYVLSFATEMDIALILLKTVNSSLLNMTDTNALINQQAIKINGLNDSVTNWIGQVDAKKLAVSNLTAIIDSLSFTTFNVDNIQAQTGVYKVQAENLFEFATEILNSSAITSLLISSNLTAAQLSARYTESIYNGNATIRMSGPDYLPFPSGVTNYLNAVSQLENLLAKTPDLITNVSSDVISSEYHVMALNESLAAFNSCYRNISAVGKDVVKAIVNFETVIRDLNTSVDMALSAQQLIMDVESNLTGDNLAQMSSNYTAEKNVSEEMRNKMLLTVLDYQPSVLKNNLETELSRLDKETTQWMQTDSEIQSMTTIAESVTSQTRDKHFTDDLDSAFSRIHAAASTAQSANQNAAERESEMNQKQSEIGLLTSRIKNVQDMQQSLQQSFTTQQSKVRDFNENLTLASTLVNIMDQPIRNVEDKIKLLENKLAKAEDLLNKLRKPLIFDGSLGLQVKNSEIGVTHLYDDVLLDVKKPGNFSDGVVLYMDAPGTESEIQIGFSNGKMFFEFNTGNQTVIVNSKADICNDCWVRVCATRYANVGHLTVTPLPSGSPVSDSVSGPDSSSNNIILNSNIYIGTLPSEKGTNKVTNRVFRGCLFNTQYQGEYLNLWTKAASATSQVKCCDVPPSSATPSLTPGISFSGLGYIELLPGNIIFSNITQLSLEIRTFSIDATLFSVNSIDQNFTLSLSSGYIQWTVFTSGLPYTLKSNKQYSNGQWIQILAIKTSSELKLSIRYLTDQNSLDVKSLIVSSLDLSSCDGKNLLFGTNSIAGNQKVTFAGCMRNVILTTSQAQMLSFSESVASSSGVSITGCYANIINGISFMSQSAFAQLASPTSLMQQLKKLELDITAQEPNGILLYISSDSGLRFFYLAVFGGNVIVVYRQNNTSSLVTSGHYISDGQVHTIKVDCSTYRVSVKIDNVPFEEKTQTLTTDYLSFPSNAVMQIGGVSSVILHSDCPVTDSIIGGISRLIVNDGSINLMDTATNANISYAGIPATPATVNTLSCADKPAPSYLSFTEGFVMTGQYEINFSQNVQGINLIEYLEKEFSIDMDLAIYKADGVLLYVADIIKSPESYFTIFIMDGRLHVRLRTTTKTDLQAVLSKSLNDGRRLVISVLRTNDFVAVTNERDKDYQNTKMNASIPSQFLIPNTNSIILGGLGVYELATSPLPETFRLQPEKVNFAGAIYSFKVSITKTDSASLKLDSLNRSSFPPISTNVYYGLSLSGVNSYLGLGLVSTLSSFTLNINFSTMSSSGMIFLFYIESSTYFLALDLNDNKLNLYLAPSFQGITEPLILPLDYSANLCDGIKHMLSFQIDNNFVIIAIDNIVKSKVNIPASHTIQPMSNAKLFIGGLKDSSLSLPQGLSKASITGCVMSVTLTKEDSTIQYDPTQYAANSFGTTYGCLY